MPTVSHGENIYYLPFGASKVKVTGILGVSLSRQVRDGRKRNKDDKDDNADRRIAVAVN